MKEFVRRDFISWRVKGYERRAVALVDLRNNWFMQGINTMRDGDMGELGPDGVYERVWYGDSLNIYDDDEYDYRPATPKEVSLYLNHCTCEWYDKEDIVAIVKGNESYVLYDESRPQTKDAEYSHNKEDYVLPFKKAEEWL